MLSSPNVNNNKAAQVHYARKDGSTCIGLCGWLRATGYTRRVSGKSGASKSLTRLVEIVPFGDHEARETWTGYLPHSMHVVDVPEVSKAEERFTLLERVGYCKQILGRYRAAEQAHRQVLVRKEKVLGKEHPDTETSMYCLAHSLQLQGQYQELTALRTRLHRLPE
jgi:hypothetical protein